MREKFRHEIHTYIRSITIMNNDKGVLAVRALRMGIYLRWNTMSRPSRVSDADMVLSFRFEIKIGTCEDNIVDFMTNNSCKIFLFARRRQKRSRVAQEMHQMDKSENLNRHLRQNISSSRALTFPCFLIIAMSLPSALSRATPAKEHLLKEFRWTDTTCVDLFHLFAGKLSSFLFFFESSNHKSRKTNGKK